ncbi:DUF1801 domain-containing protein [Roseateles terrae]|uniref:YdhG-like domain-containing protein n=1 Tax=Roseateles terrae TaxID=431060 RepID=A0ABR6GWH8_9BURK|nr:DUF1801 domain-containing protein [Roseateles terrae]MBB3196463.1 hypothetical protein [Roseateles terrae]OWQ83327.1 hypothetical protein CDN98_23100 [Roseateles terrae]
MAVSKSAASTHAKAAGPSAAKADWRAQRLDHLRSLIQAAAPDATEEAKWKKPTNPAGVPTWSDHGLICTGETYKDKIKLTFAYGASLPDPHQLFNASLDGGTRRAIDLKESDPLDEDAFQALVRAAVARNRDRS